MASSAKRLLTDETRQSLIASSAFPQSTPEDFAARLRAVSSRVRKSVTEGYLTTSPSFVKSNSTGSIFRSAHDTLREIYPLVPNCTPVASRKKRARPQSDQGYHSDGGVSEEDEDSGTGITPDAGEGAQSLMLDTKSFGRPMKALRKPRRTMMSTRSLPNGSLGLGGQRFENDPMMKGLEEEDWSISQDALDQVSPYEPMVIL